jgi:hypothetical protein
MTPERIKELLALCKAATPGTYHLEMDDTEACLYSWYYCDDYCAATSRTPCTTIAKFVRKEDADLWHVAPHRAARSVE